MPFGLNKQTLMIAAGTALTSALGDGWERALAVQTNGAPDANASEAPICGS